MKVRRLRCHSRNGLWYLQEKGYIFWSNISKGFKTLSEVLEYQKDFLALVKVARILNVRLA